MILLQENLSNVFNSHARALCLHSRMFHVLWMELGCYWYPFRLQ